MRKKYLPSLIFVYLAYFTHGMQTLSLSQNASYFLTNGDIQMLPLGRRLFQWRSRLQVSGS